MEHDQKSDTDLKPLHVVHVGKCAGESVLRGLRDANVDTVEHHCYQAHIDIERVIYRNPDAKFVVLLRDPVTRYVSSFEWDYFEKIMGRGDEFRAPQLKLWRAAFLDFKNANTLAEALSARDLDTRELAAAIFLRSKLHIHMSLSWYLSSRTIKSLTHDRIYALRVENLDDDFNTMLARMDLPARGSPLPRFKGDYRSRMPTHAVTNRLSECAVRNLLNIYVDDYHSLEALRGIGVEEAATYF